MIRFSAFTIAMISLAQVLPEGCPVPTQQPNDNGTPSERGSIQTSVSAPEAAEPGEMVALTASASGDPEGGRISYSWLQTAGPGVRIENNLAANAAFRAPSLTEDSALDFLVTTRNERGDVGRASTRVQVRGIPNPGPGDNTNNNNNFNNNSNDNGAGTRLRASAGADQTVMETNTVTLRGGASGGENIRFAWSQVGGTTVTLTGADTANPTFIAPAFLQGGLNRLEFELAVTDGKGNTAKDRVVIIIQALSDTPPDDAPQVRFVTNFGDIVVELDPEAAPRTVENFLQYVDDGFYAGTIFHRVIPGFVIQGGGFSAGLSPKETRDPIPLEADNGLRNNRGTIAMARTNQPDSATSQFYINLVNNDTLNADTNPPGYAVFGRVISGISVVDRIATTATESRQGFNDVPVNDVIIRRAERVTN